MLIDGDASSEMVLANHLYQTRRILSRDWFYSTEIRLIEVDDLLFPVLFNFFTDWTSIRIIGTLLSQLLLVLSFIYMMRQAKKPLSSIFLGSALLLTPYNVAYGRIVLYQYMYVGKIMLGFLQLGLFFDITEGDRENGLSQTVKKLILLRSHH